MVGGDVGASWGVIAVQLGWCSFSNKRLGVRSAPVGGLTRSNWAGADFATGRAAFYLDIAAIYLDGIIIFSWNFCNRPNTEIGWTIFS